MSQPLILLDQIKGYLESNPPGWCWPVKAGALAASVHEVNAKLVVEVGVFGGRSLIPMAMAAKHAKQGLVVGIDPWRKEAALETLDPVADAAHIAWWSSQDLDAIYKFADNSIWKHELEAHCILLKATSQTGARLFSPKSIDVLHIDGCHTEVVSCRDVELWLPLCRHGAYIWFDDSNWASTQKAVHLLEASCEPLLTLSNEGSEARLFRKL